MKFTITQLHVISEISRDIAQVAFAAMVVTPLLTGLENLNLYVILSGIVVTFTFWFVGVFVLRKAKR